jgi:hypothetical protein
MNLNILAISVMVLITREWLANPVIVAELTRHHLGASIWKEIARAHKLISEFRQQRMSVEAALAKLTEKLTYLDDRHDRKARSLRTLLLALAEATNDPALARKLLDLDALLFPNQLRVIHMSYFAEAGSIIELEQRVTAETTNTLESIRVGDQTLADIYREWIEAGHELGRLAQERARIEASLSTSGSTAPQTRARKVRSAWIRTVRLLLASLDMLELSSAARESLLAPLEKSVQDAMLRRGQNGPGTNPDDMPDGEPESEPEGEPDTGPGDQPDIGPGTLSLGTTPAELATTPAGSEL